jgi:drug/metabolite transporter (DMT)-like permease
VGGEAAAQHAGPPVTGVALTIAFAAALCYALAAALQQRQAETAAARARSVLRLLAGLVRRPIWLFGFAVGGLGIALHAVALRWAPLALVQPVGVSALLFAVPLGAGLRRRLPAGRELVAAVMVAAGLAGVLLTLHPVPRPPHASGAQLVALVTVAATGLAITVVVAAALTGTARLLVLAVAAGGSFGLTAALVRVIVHQVADAGVAGMLSPLFALLAGTATTGLLLEQAAYASGSLALSLAVITIADPIAAVTTGVLLLDQPVHAALPVLTTVAGLVAAAGVGVLARERRSGAPSRRTHAQPAAPRPGRNPVRMPTQNRSPRTAVGARDAA